MLIEQSLAIPLPAVQEYLADTNPWWVAGKGIDADIAAWPKRAYFASFIRLVKAIDVRRAVVVIGPRRVGKTVMLTQAVQNLLDSGVPGSRIMVAQMDVPLFSGQTLGSLVNLFVDTHRHKPDDPASALYIFFDEIQYLKDWETHLKVLVDTYKGIRFVATGSAAAALRAGTVAEAREAINAWNEKNPDQRMSPNMPAIWRRVREMAKDKDQRIADTAPKAMRQQFREETARVREAL